MNTQVYHNFQIIYFLQITYAVNDVGELPSGLQDLRKSFLEVVQEVLHCQVLPRDDYKALEMTLWSLPGFKHVERSIMPDGCLSAFIC